MKERKGRVNNAEKASLENFEDKSSLEMTRDIIGTKVLYNWLYQQEEEDYYLRPKIPGALPDFCDDEVLFVEYLDLV